MGPSQHQCANNECTHREKMEANYNELKYAKGMWVMVESEVDDEIVREIVHLEWGGTEMHTFQNRRQSMRIRS